MPTTAVRCVLMLMLSASASALAQTVYRSVSPDGAVTFTDQPTPGAVAIDLPSIDVPEARADAAREAVEDMLKVAGLLEASRLRREQIRSARVLARQALQIEADRRALLAEAERPRYAVLPVTGFWHRRGFRHRGAHATPVEAAAFEPSVFAPPPFKPPAFHP